MNDRVRIEIGFEGGGAFSTLTPSHHVDQLEGALSSGGDGAFSLEADDGKYTLVLRKITYVKRFARESRVGFGAP